MKITKWAKSKKMIMLESGDSKPKWYFLQDDAYKYGKQKLKLKKGEAVGIDTDGEEDGLKIISKIRRTGNQQSSSATSSTTTSSSNGNSDFNKQNVLKSIGAILNVEVIDDDLGNKICELYDKVYNHIYGG